MIYTRFNLFIKNRFFRSENRGSHVVLSVDKQVIDEFCQENDITEQQLKDEFRKLFTFNWDEAFKPDNFFGLIALQVYVAHSMGEKDGYSKNEYNQRLEDILKFSYLPFNIEKLYKDYQDSLWGKMKIWCEERGFFIEIPKPRSYSGCYIQYPLSQALLNQYDLDRLPLLFSSNWIKPFHRIDFCEFRNVIKELEPKQKNILSTHFFQVKERLQKYRDGLLLDLLYRQIFEYYCNWGGEIPVFESKQFKVCFNRQELLKSSNILIFNEQNIQVLDYKYNLIETISIDTIDLFHRIKKHYKLFNSEYVFFIKDEYDDWVETEYLETGSNNLILLGNTNGLIYSFKQHNLESKITSFKYFSTIEIELQQGYEAEGWLGRNLKERNKPCVIVNGLKLDRKTWMFQAGPDIKFEKIVDAWLINSDTTNNIEKLKLTINGLIKKFTSYPPGQYVLAIRDYGKIKFEIKEPSNNSSNCTKGWKISKKSALWKSDSEPFQVCGLVNSFSTEQDSNSEIRDWINANMIENQKEQNQINTLIINAINRAKHGIR